MKAKHKLKELVTESKNEKVKLAFIHVEKHASQCVGVLARRKRDRPIAKSNRNMVPMLLAIFELCEIIFEELLNHL